jgi:hypothetical protein
VDAPQGRRVTRRDGLSAEGDCHIFSLKPKRQPVRTALRLRQLPEETFDPLGQVLEHYSFLREFTMKCASSGQALLLYFELLDEGSV